MAKHLSNGPCPSCGSRDNLASYDDGSQWCWGCHYYQRGSINKFVIERQNEQNQTVDGQQKLDFPSDFSTTIVGRGYEWLSKYGLTAAETLRAGWGWSEYRQQLLFPFYDKTGTLCCLQARNFSLEWASKAKYWNIGDKTESETIYYKRSHGRLTAVHKQRNYVGRVRPHCEERTLVLCEDAVSSLKVARYSPSKPLLGTSLAKDKIMALRGFYDELVVWLDSDKWKEARHLSEQAQLLGFKSRAIFTDLDPKEYENTFIEEILK